MSKFRFLFFTFTTFFGFLSYSVQAQTAILGQDTARRPILTAVPFLAITPDSRAGAMGDAGVATSPDANAMHWNPSKLAFANQETGFSLSYNPWLRNLVNDMFLAYLTAYRKISKNEAVGFELKYFSMGEIQFTSPSGVDFGKFYAREFSLGFNYSRKLSNRLSAGIGGRFIHSNLGDIVFGGTSQDPPRPGVGGSADLSLYYENPDIKINGQAAKLAFGINISNIGPKISYLGRGQGDFIPTNLRFGTALTMSLDPFEKNKLAFALDFNKLMVPSPKTGVNPRDITLISGMFGSFGDAQDGAKEELREFTIGGGLEYSYNEVFFARAGHFNESRFKGNRKYYTVGVGFKYNNFGADVSYLIPQQQNNPLAETLRFTLHLNLGEKNSGLTGDSIN
jgi:hypothetical protein